MGTIQKYNGTGFESGSLNNLKNIASNAKLKYSKKRQMTKKPWILALISREKLRAVKGIERKFWVRIRNLHRTT
jgi:hypothetical protein